MRIAVGQFASVQDQRSNLDIMTAMARDAAHEHASLVVFPEAAMAPFATGPGEAANIAEDLDGPFVSALIGVSRSLGIDICCGIFERSERIGLVHNTVVLLGPDGLRGRYRKIHLVDALGWSESSWVAPGEADIEELLVADYDGVTVGVATCYDLRFPEIFRALVDRGANALLVPASWEAGPLKEMHWLALLQARAIENTSYVVGVGQAPPNGAARTVIVDPMGVVVADAGDQQNVLVVDLDVGRIAATRERLPVLTQRRFFGGA